MRYPTITLLFLVNTVCMLNPAYGHVGGQTDSVIDVGQSKIKILYTLPGDSLLELDPQQTIDPEAVLTPTTHSALLKTFVIKNNAQPCELTIDSSEWMKSIPSVMIEMTANCSESLDRLRVQYDLFLDQASDHTNNTVVYLGNDLSRLEFSTELRFFEVDINELMRTTGMITDDNFDDIRNKQNYFSNQEDINYFQLGGEHIITGYDHLLFLFSLLLIPLTLRQAFILITGFTLAHSITLILATLELIILNSRLVEIAIAASIVLVAAENIRLQWRQAPSYSVRTHNRIIATFVIGLIHGLGFSGFLTETGLGENPIAAMLYFNLGVEAGQLLMVIPMLALLYGLRKLFDPRYTNLTLSAQVILVGGFWMIERI